MKKNLSGETLVGIMIVVSLIALVVIGMLKVLEFDESVNLDVKSGYTLTTLEQNTNSIIQKIDTSSLSEWDLFYIKKDELWYTISTDDTYQYINQFGDQIDPSTTKDPIFRRICAIQKDSDEGQMIQCEVKQMIKK